jgi:hypothetical protein
MRPPEKHRRRARVPLPRLGESTGGVVVRDDAGGSVPEAGQVGGEDIGLPGRQGREAQASAGGEIEDRADFPLRLQSAENGDFAVLTGRPAYPQFLDVRQRRGVQGGARAQEFPGSGEEVVDVLGEVPVVREHAS